MQGHVRNLLFHFCQLWAVNFETFFKQNYYKTHDTCSSTFNQEFTGPNDTYATLDLRPHLSKGLLPMKIYYSDLLAANWGIIFCGHFSDCFLTILLLTLGVHGVVATWQYLFLLQSKNIAAINLKLPVHVIIAISFHNQQKTHQNWIIS